MTWWCEHGQGGIYARLVEQFEVVDESLRLRSPDSLNSWLGHGFDFKRLVARTLALIGAISLDTSRPGNERVPDLTMGPCPCVPISTLAHEGVAPSRRRGHRNATCHAGRLRCDGAKRRLWEARGRVAARRRLLLR